MSSSYSKHIHGKVFISINMGTLLILFSVNNLLSYFLWTDRFGAVQKMAETHLNLGLASNS